MGIIKNKLNSEIQKDNLKQVTNDSIGVILSYDKLSNTATVKYPNPNGEGYLFRHNTRMSNSFGGFTTDGIQPGIKCSLTFLNHNIYMPIITGLITNSYTLKTNTDQGAYLADRTILFDFNIPSSITPMCESWIDEDNDNVYKYATEIQNFSDSDISKDTYNLIDELDKYKTIENGITNLNSKSNMKCKDNGDIEVFVSNTVGFRISTVDHKIYFYGKGIYLNDKEIKSCECDLKNYNGNNDNSNLDSNDDSEYNDDVELLTVDVEELKRCIAYLKIITGFENKYSTLEQKIKEYEGYRDSYQKGVTPKEEVIRLNTLIAPIKALVEKELYDAQNVLNSIL